MIHPSRRPHRWQFVLRVCPLLAACGLFIGLLQLPSVPRDVPASGSDEGVQEQSQVGGPVYQGDSAARNLVRHLACMGIEGWHKKGSCGKNVKVAILDSGFKGYQGSLGKALPKTVQTHSFRNDGNLEARDSQHGVLCAEVVHAVAPEAELLLANWEPNEPASFLQAVRWAKDQGARVISCSLIMPSWSDGEGGGSVNQALAELAGQGNQAGDLLFFASAGNTAQRHWCGTYNQGTDGFHQWKSGETINTLTPWGDERVAVELYGAAAGLFDLVVKDAQTGQAVGDKRLRYLGSKGSKINCVGNRFAPEAGKTYQILVKSKKPSATKVQDKIHLMVLGGQLAHSCPGGSIAFPADGAGALAVGAVNPQGQRWTYSSCGPNSALPKPDYVAVVPFPSKWHDRPFAGTSAAAPQAAGLAALMWSKNSAWYANEVKDGLRQSALDLGPKGHDFETGYGLMRAP